MFEFVVPESLDEALDLWHERARWFGGGTDLVTALKADLVQPARLINLKHVPELGGMTETEGGLRLGALTTLAEIGHDPRVRERYRALAQACEVSASPQLRNAATIGGNLAQGSRCPYFRGPFDCWLKGGEVCYMREGENREAAVAGYADCVHVHPSDPATALVALEARVVVRGKHSAREIPVADLLLAPGGDNRRLNVLHPEELVTAVVLPRRSNSQSAFLKAMDRAAWAFALASAGVRIEFEGRRIAGARVVIGGVAPIPWQAPEAAQILVGHTPSVDLAERAANAVLADARPLAHNGYKVRLARTLVKRAILEAAR